jgi:hypothetical protein
LALDGGNELGAAFAYTVARVPLPGGADSRAIELSRAVRRCASAFDR